jgi:hypothetical protein
MLPPMTIYQDAGHKREFVIPIPYKPPPNKKALDGLLLQKLRKIRDCSLIMITRLRSERESLWSGLQSISAGLERLAPATYVFSGAIAASLDAPFVDIETADRMLNWACGFSRSWVRIFVRPLRRVFSCTKSSSWRISRLTVMLDGRSVKRSRERTS